MADSKGDSDWLSGVIRTVHLLGASCTMSCQTQKSLWWDKLENQWATSKSLFREKGTFNCLATVANSPFFYVKYYHFCEIPKPPLDLRICATNCLIQLL